MSASDRSFISAGVFTELLALFLAYMLGTHMVNRFGKRAVHFVFRRLFHVSSVNRYLYLLLVELGFCVIVFLLRSVHKFIRSRRRRVEARAFLPGTSLAASFRTGGYLLAFIALSLVVNTFDAVTNGYALQGRGTILYSVVYFLLVGLAEEGMFRGVLAGGFLEEAGSASSVVSSVDGVQRLPEEKPLSTGRDHLSDRTIWCGVIFSSVLFSLAHGRSLLTGPDFGTVIQMIGAFCMGLYLAAVYYRTRNIWAVALLHGLNDIAAGLFVTIFRVEESLGGVVAGYSWGNLIPIVPFVIVAVFLLRPAGMEKIREMWCQQER